MEMKVSVYCLAFNHGKYIRDTLEGFVKQKTNFGFEVFVHDDASSDNTAEIILEYAKKYPNMIKPILQKENQYSKGVRVLTECIFPKMSGKYVAVCEGDDYWIDENKLQLQVDFLDNNDEYSACVHNTVRYNCITDKTSLFNESKEEYDLSIEKVLQKGGAEFHTSSVMYRCKYTLLPQEFYIKEVGDYPRAIYLALCGKVHYFPQAMSTYRMYVAGSWSSRTFASKDYVDRIAKHYSAINDMLNKVNIFSNKKYEKIILNIIRMNEMLVLIEKGNWKQVRKNYSDILFNVDSRTRIKYFLKCKFPQFVELYRRQSGKK